MSSVPFESVFWRGVLDQVPPARPTPVAEKRPRSPPPPPVVVKVGVWDVETTAPIPPSRSLAGLRISVGSVALLDGEDDVLNAETSGAPEVATVLVGLGEPASRLFALLDTWHCSMYAIDSGAGRPDAGALHSTSPRLTPSASITSASGLAAKFPRV